jgi:septum formation protein
LIAAPLILASGSPRRRAFMELLGLSFEVHVADVDERSRPGEHPVDLVARLSRAKARAVAAQHPRAVVIGADTVVTLEGEILGKPVGPAEATAMLRSLRDRAHWVYSGICVHPPRRERVPGGAPSLTAVVESTVWMRAYTDDEIAAYVASGAPLDKAGAYGIQDARFHPVARLQGCYASVMGLPLCHLERLLLRATDSANARVADVPALCSAFTGVPCCGGERVELTLE